MKLRSVVLVSLFALAAPARSFAAPVTCNGLCVVSTGAAVLRVDIADCEISGFELHGTDHVSSSEFHLNPNGLGDAQDIELDDIMTQTSATEDDATNEIACTYESNDLRVTLTYELIGDDSSAQVDVRATIGNRSGSTQSYTVLHHADWDLNNSSSGDTVEYLGDGEFIFTEGETRARYRALTPPTHYSAAPCCENWAGGNLDDNPGPLGPDDVAGEFQYDLTLANDTLATLELQLQIGSPGVAAPALSSVGLALLVLMLTGCAVFALIPRQSPR